MDLHPLEAGPDDDVVVRDQALAARQDDRRGGEHARVGVDVVEADDGAVGAREGRRDGRARVVDMDALASVLVDRTALEEVAGARDVDALPGVHRVASPDLPEGRRWRPWI